MSALLARTLIGAAAQLESLADDIIHMSGRNFVDGFRGDEVILSY
jgi:hypothetical protein